MEKLTKDEWIKKINEVNDHALHYLDYLEIEEVVIKNKIGDIKDIKIASIPENAFFNEIRKKDLESTFINNGKLRVRSDMFVKIKSSGKIGTIEEIDNKEKKSFITIDGFSKWFYNDGLEIVYGAKNKLRIGVDQDWVLAKLTKKWLEYYNAIFDDDLKAEDLESWDITEKVKPGAKNFMLNILNIPEFYRDLEVTKDSQRVLKKLAAAGHEIFIVTDPFTKMSMKSKFEWLQEHFSFIDRKNYIFTASKNVIDLDILIDDGVHNCESFKGIPILFDTPYNQKETRFIKARNWQDVENIFDYRMEELLK